MMNNSNSHSFMQIENKKHGSVLILCLGILALLSLLGTAVMLLTRQEEIESQNYSNKTKAQFAAESAIETALAKLLDFRGSLQNMPAFFSSTPASSSVSLDYTPVSSFGILDLDGDGLNETAGYISETYTSKGDRFNLRVESCQSKININDTDSPLNIDTDPWEDQITPERDYESITLALQHPDGFDPDWAYPGQPDYVASSAPTPNRPYPKARGRLWNMIKIMAEVIFDEDSTFGSNVANAIFKARRQNASDRFAGFHEIRNALVPAVMNDDQCKLFTSYLTLESWQDRSVLLPTFQWRINRPPRLDPSDLISAHPYYFPGDWTTEFNPYGCPRPVQRPGTLYPGSAWGEMMGAVPFDYNGDGTIQTPDINAPYAYHEYATHSRDIYLFSDMQTRYFATESRSPIDINQAPLPLIQALIEPIQGWYLKEAPATWDGEDIRTRAEDWSQPVLGTDFNQGVYLPAGLGGFPWYCCTRIGTGSIGGFGFEGWDVVDDWFRADECQYYFYDAYAKAYPIDLNPIVGQRDYCCQFAEKSARYGELQQSKAFDRSTAKKLAQAIYYRVHPDFDGDNEPDSFNPFLTWEEFEYFVHDLCDIEDAPLLTGNLTDFDIYMANSVIANFNPNSRLNDGNPNKNFFLYVDKSQLIGYSTELCFQPMGYFDIQSKGSVQRSNDELLAVCRSQSTVQIHQTLRVTAQNHFLKGYNPVSKPLSQFFSQSQSTSPTAGATFDNTGNLSSLANFNGHSLQAYPEAEAGTINNIINSAYDGYLMLATKKVERDDLFAIGLTGENANNCFLVNLDGTFNAQYSEGEPIFWEDSENTAWIVDKWRYMHWTASPSTGWNNVFLPDTNAQVPANQPSLRALTRSLSAAKDGLHPEDRPGNLLPDGALCDAGRTLVYNSKSNIGDPVYEGRNGSLQFWIKPNFDVAHSNRVRKFFTAPPRIHNDPDPGYAGYTELSQRDLQRDFSLLYFSCGGRRVTPDPVTDRLDDSIYLNYDPDYSLNDGRWLPTRSIFMNAGNYAGFGTNPWDGGYPTSGRTMNGIGSTSVNQSWREAQDITTPANWTYNMESHQWSHLAMSWDWVGTVVPNGTPGSYNGITPPEHYYVMSINGHPVSEDREQHPPFHANPTSWQYYGYFGTQQFPLQFGIHQDNAGQSTYLAFGESSSALWGNHCADATFDDFVCSKIQKNDIVLGLEFGYGRYYDISDAIYTSPLFDLFDDSLNSANALTLINVAWTAYLPRRAENSLPANHRRFNDNFLYNNSDLYTDMLIKTKGDNQYPSDPCANIWGGNHAPFSIDLQKPASTDWLYETNEPEAKPNFAGGSIDDLWNSNEMQWKASSSREFRFRIYFNILDGQTLYTSPVFDDATFNFAMDKAKIIFWENL